MSSFTAAAARLASIPHLTVLENVPLDRYTRFAIGGPAAVLCDTADENAFVAALDVTGALALPWLVLGGGTNLVVADTGFEGIALRYTGAAIEQRGQSLHVAAGAILQDVVDRSIALELEGLQTMTGIPGYLGGAVYGNAGAYGHSIQELVEEVRFFNGARVVAFSNSECHFHYRESIFKDRKNWVILSANLRFSLGVGDDLARAAHEIRTIRDAKYPPDMKCAGSIFKNLLVAELPPAVVAAIPPKVVREGKVPSAWFLEQVGAKGLRRGDIRVAEYHANLLYNDGAGRAADLVALIDELKRRVRARFGFDLEEEVQYVGFQLAGTSA